MFKIKNVDSQPTMTHTLGESKNGTLRNKLTVLNVAGKVWKEKRDLVQEKLEVAFERMPEGVAFCKRKTPKNKWNPDGLRLLVHCAWIRRNRFYDEDGMFKLGTLIKAINKQIEGETKYHILNDL